MFGSLNDSRVWDNASAPSLAPSDSVPDPLLTPPPTSYHEMRARLSAVYEHGIETGQFRAHVWPLWTLHIFFLALYFILVPPSWLDAEAARGSAWRRGRRWVLMHGRFPLFLWYTWRSFVVVSDSRSPSGFGSYGVGLQQVFFFWWFAALFIFRDPRFDCMRLEREKIVVDGPSTSTTDQKDRASTTGADGHASSGSRVHSRSKAGPAQETETREKYRYYWQGMPPTLGHRVRWYVDLMTSLRGAGWTHQIRTVPFPPPEALAQLPDSSSRSRSKATPARFQGPDARTRLLRHFLSTFAVCYVFADLSKSFILVRDPYWGGLLDAPFPPGLLPRFMADSPVFVRLLRTWVTGLSLFVMLNGFGTFLLVLIFVCTGRDSIKAEPCMYPDVFGDPRVFLDHGLAGLWGEWWHQVMRIAVATPGEALSAACGWSRRDARSRATTTMVAFLVSGSLHAAGCYTLLGGVQPVNHFVFFALQGLGIIFETLVGSVCATRLGLRLPAALMRVVRGLWVVVFMSLTGPLFADEMTKGYACLDEFLPVSIFRGLGMGPAASDGWLLWHGLPVSWHWGDVWWKSGIVM